MDLEMVALLGGYGLALVASVGLWYYRFKFRSADDALTALQTADAGQMALAKTMAAEVTAARAALAQRQEKERVDDAHTVEMSAGSPSAASALLNGLHADGAGSGGPASSGVPAAGPAAVPGADGRTVR